MEEKQERQRYGCKGWHGGVSVGLILLTGSTSHNIVTNKGGEAWPPKFCGD